MAFEIAINFHIGHVKTYENCGEYFKLPKHRHY